MKWSLLIGRLWGTEIRLHTSLLLVIPYVLYIARPADLSRTLYVLLLLVALFACVLLHELGHTLAARLVGIEVKSVVLWPLGGFANLSRRPERVLHNLLITAAGPFTNLVLAAVMAILLLGERLLTRSELDLGLPAWLEGFNLFPLLAGLLLANLSLVVFNLIPIYPLDGGHIARDLLKLVFGEKNADLLLIFISLPLAAGLVVLGIFSSDLLVVLTALLLVLASLTLNQGLANAIQLGMLYLFDRGSYYLRTRDYDRAVAFYSHALHRRPHQSGLFLNRAIAYYNLMAGDAAWQDVNRALQLDPRNYMAWTLKGEISETARHDFELALNCYNRAIALNENWPLAYADRAGLHQRQGRYDLALANLELAAARQQGLAIVHLLRSILRYRMGDIPGSHSDSDLVLHFAPTWMLTFQEIFLSNLDGHLDWALDYYQRAGQKMPGAYQVVQGRADVLRIHGRLTEALADYQRAIQLAPQQAELYLRRGKTYRAAGQTEQAAADFQQAMSRAAFSHVRRQAQAELQALNSAAAGGVEPGEVPAGSTAPSTDL